MENGNTTPHELRMTIAKTTNSFFLEGEHIVWYESQQYSPLKKKLI